MTARRIEAMDSATRRLMAASYTVPNLVVAVQEAVYNAIDANAKHVTVVIDTTQASFSVSDDGDGIDPDAMFEHLFENQASSKADHSTRKYGRRGQYLVALGTLAKQVEIESRVPTHWTSFRKVVQSAHIVFNARSKSTKMSKGTLLRVQCLFWLLPVRQRELEAHASARTRVTKRLNSFFLSISMIWPTLSVDVSFTDAKVPRTIIPGAQNCEERLRGVFGDILGGELEYITFVKDEMPFTIRGYAAVVRDAGDGDLHLESPGWRQARAYYQFVYLDNFWLEDFQRECCKAINNTAVALELGIPIYVLKVSARSDEYEIHSDGNTRMVNVKRPEMLVQMMRRFVEMLQTRVMEADASVNDMKESPEECKAPSQRVEYGSADRWDDEDHKMGMPVLDDRTFGGDDDLVCARYPGTCEWDDVTSCTHAMEHKRDESYGYFDDSSDVANLDAYDDYISYASDNRHMIPIEYSDGRTTPSTIVYEEPAYAAVYDDMCADDYTTMTPYTGYRGCMHCGSCGSYAPDLRFVDNFPYYAEHQNLEHDGADAYFEADSSHSFEYDDTMSEYGVTIAFDATSHYHEDQLCLNNESETVVQWENVDCFETEIMEPIVPDLSVHDAQTTAQIKQQQDFDQLFFSKGYSFPPRHRKEMHENKKEDVSETRWVSSRRIGVVHAQTPTEESGERPIHVPDHDQEETKAPVVETNLVCGSRQLSEYFSMEKLAKACPRSLGKSISRFASKRTALTGSVRSYGLEPHANEIHVRKLPSDLHAPNAKIMTLDKALLRQLQVIRQVDRKFILVKASLEPSVSDRRDDADDASSRTLLLCIDQHAADERVRLEQLEMQVFGVDGNERNIEAASHTPPLVLSLNDRERETLRLFADEIKAWGFGIENPADRIIRLIQTPKVDSRVAGVDDLREYLRLLARSDAVLTRRVVRPPVLTRFLHSRACRSAIMFGDYLSHSQCVDIIEQLRECQLPFQCAHGRPSVAPLAELA